MNKSKWHAENSERVSAWHKEYRQQKLAENPNYYKDINRKSYAKHRDRRLAEQRANYPSKRPKYLQQKYGLSQEQFEEMLARQEGGCAICRTTVPGGRYTRLHVDHCHKGGQVRQLLCNACNHLLGCAKDRPEVLRAAATYLERHEALVLTEPEKSS